MHKKLVLKASEVLPSLSFVRAKIYGKKLSEEQLHQVISDMVDGRYSDAQIAAFVAACAASGLDGEEIFYLTKAMINTGAMLEWDEKIVVDKHCIGGVPGNRTTPIIVPIVATYGLLMPKTSSRSITSVAGTADVVEVLTPVNLDVTTIRRVVTQHRGCMAWGGSAALSPADDILIHVERALDLDGEGQMIASILSKKIAVGSNCVLIDMPIGKSAKVRDINTAKRLKKILIDVAERFGMEVKIVISDGSQPVGFGVGPALEASDVVAVLQNDKNAPQDLRERAILLAGEILEFDKKLKGGEGKKIAEEILNSGKAWQKFQDICQAQGGLQQIPQAQFQQKFLAPKAGVISEINNRQIAIAAKIAGAPQDKAAGLKLSAKAGDEIKEGDVLLTIHSNDQTAIDEALDYFRNNQVFVIS